MSTGKLAWVLWHPHQKLWNWRLTLGLRRLPGGATAGRLVVAVDSALLVARVIARRARVERARRLSALPDRFLYLDCGLHKEGLQVPVVAGWFGERMMAIGFEASPQYAADVAKALAEFPVEVRQEALVGPDHEGPTIRLYRAGGDGRGDSLFAERGADYDDVPAVRLSTVLAQWPPYYPVLLRMNIEGAEQFVIDDLIEAGMINRIAGFYGMWDDLAKIDPDRDAQFRQLLRRHRIHPVTFNDRDLGHPLRMWAIRYDMATHLMVLPPA